MLRWFIIIVVLLLVVFAVYVRFAPTDVSAVHAPSYPADVGDRDELGRFQATRQFTASEADVLKAIDTVIQRTPRTKLVAGSVEEGLMTYETRSRVWGFPDYTTVWVDSTIEGAGPHVNIRGQLRYGKADLDVNKNRIQGWIAELGPLIVAP